MTPGALRRLPLAAGLGAWILCAAYILVTTVVAVVRAYTPVLFWDQWADLATLMAFDLDGGSLAQLLRLHNEHVILVPRLFYLLDYFLFDATGSSLIALNVILRALVCAVLIRETRLARELPWALRLFLAAATLALLFSAVQIGHFTMGFDAQFALLFAAAVAAFPLVAGAAERSDASAVRWTLLGLSLGCAAIATFSASNGMLVPVLLVLYVWTSPLGRRERLAVTGAALVILASRWGVGFRPVSLDLARARPALALQSAVAYLGSPLWLWPARAKAFGVAGLTLGSVAALTGLVRLPHLPRFARVHVMIVLFVLASAAAVAVGRTGWPDDYVLVSRYAPGPLLLWVSLMSLGVFAVQQHPRLWRAGVPLCCALVAAFVVGVLLPAQPLAAQAGLRDRAERERGELALVVGAYDEAALQLLYWDPVFVLERRPYLRQERRTSFAQDWTMLLGRSLVEVFRIAPAPGAGTLGGLRLLPRPPAALHLPRAVQVYGSTGTTIEAEPPFLVLVDGEGVIRGFGRPPPREHAAGQAAAGPRTWMGYALVEGPAPFQAYAVSADFRMATPLLGTRDPYALY